MMRCPDCGRTYYTLTHCLNDGAALVEEASTSPVYPELASRDYAEEVPLADFEEAPTPAGSGGPGFRLPPLAVPTGPPPYDAVQTRRTRGPQSGVVLLGILGLFALSVGGLELLRHGLQEDALKEDSPPVTVPATATDSKWNLFPGLKLDDTLTQTPDGTLRQSLISTVKQADAAETQSFRTLNPAPSHPFFTGDALAVELGELQSLKHAGTTQESRLTAQRFKDFQVNPDHTKAQVDVAETWKTITRSRTGCRRVQKSHSNPLIQQVLSDPNGQILSLKHTAHGWVIENIQFYEF